MNRIARAVGAVVGSAAGDAESLLERHGLDLPDVFGRFQR
jgi:hypothetical protein